MEKSYETVVQETTIKIGDLQKNADEVITTAETAIEVLLFSLRKLREMVKMKGFNTKDEEIEFFKKIKPTLYSLLIFNNKILKIELKKPIGSYEYIRQYYIKMIEYVNEYFQRNSEFIVYIRSGATYMDKYYFVRGKLNIEIVPENFTFDHDENFSTSHDYKVAELMAYEYLANYLIRKIENIVDVVSFGLNTLIWTKSKSALIELIYALFLSNCFGEASIKEIATFFEKAFKIDLGDYYRTFIEISKRKNIQPKFIETLLMNLKQKLLEKDI